MRRASVAERPSLLCVEDNAALAELLSYVLEGAGYAVHIARTGVDAQRLATIAQPALVLLDMEVSGIDGLALSTYIRSTLHRPVILLGAPSTTDEEMALAFERGAADYVTKPFNPHVLLYRICVALRGTGAAALAAEHLGLYVMGGAVFDARRHAVDRGCGQVRLTSIESAILQLLLRDPQQIFSAEQIMTRVWGADTPSNATAVRTHIHRLRAKLAGVLGGLDHIHTEPGKGYTYRHGDR